MEDHPSDLTCSEQTRALGGSIAGTAVASTHTWLCVEVRAAWGPKGLGDTELPEGVEAALRRAAPRGSGVRVQLIRQPRAASEDPVTVLLARVRPGEEAVRRLRLGTLAELVDVDLESWIRAPGSLGEAVEEPLYLVCTHGRRDRCCALHGVAVWLALSAWWPQDTWQTSHLGGHRFAATLLALPEGVCFGQVEPDEAEALHEAWRSGVLYDASRVRGRVAWSRAAQAAEVLGGFVGRAAPSLHGQAELGDGVVRVDLGGQRLTLEERTLGEQEASCGSGKPKPVREWVLRAGT